MEAALPYFSTRTSGSDMAQKDNNASHVALSYVNALEAKIDGPRIGVDPLRGLPQTKKMN